MEIILLIVPPLLFLSLASVMVVVSQVAGHFMFVLMSGRQKASNQVLSSYIQGLAMARSRLARRTRELARLSQRLARSNEDLENLNRLKSRFLSMAVHDIRGPLATIRGAAELLNDRGLAPDERRSVRSIIVSTENAGRLMSDLTDLAIIEAGKLRMNKEPFDVPGLVADVLAQTTTLAAQKGVDLAVTSVTDGTIVADRFRLGQVLLNLIGNAIKFTPAGGRVQLSALAAGSGVLFCVSDNGPGIHPTERRKVFDKFYQSRFNDAKTSKAGWGLGLAIATEIVRGHQGEIGVESAGLGRGSKFWFFVPATAPANAGYQPKAPRAMLPMAGLLLLLSFASARIASAQSLTPQPPNTIPLDDKARYERFLEDKAESVLLRILGPNRAKVVVDATLDFSRVEKFKMTTGDDEKKDDTNPDALFLWDAKPVKKGEAPKQLLPGIPTDPQQTQPAPTGPPQSYERQYSYPISFVKKLVVTIIVDRSVPNDQSDTIESIVSNLLDIDPSRGDVLTMVRASFAPAWKTIWYSQDSFSMVLRYSVLTLLTLMTLVVVAMCFLKLAAAIETMARAQSGQYSMDMGLKNPELESAEDEKLLEAEAEEEKPEEKVAEEEQQAITIEVKDDQMENLITMIQDEDAENIALVSAYLAPAARKRFMSMLSRERQMEVLKNMSSVRFVEPDVIMKIKAEIEHRLSGAVGGMSRVYDFIETAPPNLQRELLRELETKDPELYAILRSRVLLMEDLVQLKPEEWSLIMGRVHMNDWATALRGAPPELAACVQAQVLPQTWAIVEQIMESQSVANERILASQNAIIDIVRGLIEEGKVENPVKKRAAQPAAIAAEPAAAAEGVAS
jgi:signal transduction histidine kinase/flagellar motor switch protein FliG